MRRAHNLGVTALAAAVGKDASTYARYERGTTTVPDEVKRALVDRYEVSVEYLMGWEREAA